MRLIRCLLGTTMIFGTATLVAAPPVSAQTQGVTGGDVNAIVLHVTGGALTDVSSEGSTLEPSFTAADTDYVWYCDAGKNNIDVNLSGSSSITVDGQTGMHVSVPVVATANQAVVIDSPDNVQYWIRCLPPTFPKLVVSGDGTASPGYYVTGSFKNKSRPGYPMILNSYGTPVWYGAIDGSAQDTEVLPGTHTVTWANNPTYDLFDLDTDSMSTLAPPVTPFDGHELYTDTSGNHWMLSVPTKSGYDLSGLGHPGLSNIKDCVVQELNPAGKLIWQWDASDYVSPNETNGLDGVEYNNGVPELDVYHCNSIDVDPLNPNHILVSMRHVGVLLINKKTGDPIWKLGGTSAPTMTGEPNLTIVNDPESVIRGQHDARFEPNGDISLFDDHTKISGAARGVEYAISAKNETATMVWEYVSPTGDNSNAMGSVRRYDSGYQTYDQVGSSYTGPVETVIDWGHGAPTAGFVEVGPDNDVQLSVAFAGVDGNRAEKLSPSDLSLATLRDLAGTTLPAPSS